MKITTGTGDNRKVLLGASLTVLSLTAAHGALAADPKDSLEEVVVTGVRASLDSAQDLKKQSDQVIDSIVAEDIGKLPDNNVADALARVTGVQIRRDSGEGNAVLIRGLPNITTLLNGREVFTTFSRFIALADIPATMLKRVDVYKTSSAELLEGGIAGTIDVSTRHPFDSEGFHFNSNIRGVYSDKSKSTDPDLGLTLSDTWDTGAGDIGVLIGASYTPRNYHEERAFNVAPEPQGFRFDAAHPAPVADIKGPFVIGQIPIAGDRRRTAFNAAVEWRPSDRSKIYFDGFQTDYKNDFELDFFVGLPWLGDGNLSATVFPGTNQTKTLTNHNVFTITSTQANRAHSITRQGAVGGSFQTENGLTFSTDFAKTTSSNEFQNPIMDVSTIVPDVFVDTNHNGTMLMDYGGANYDIKNGRNFSIANWFDNYGRDDGDSSDWRGDVEWKPESASVLTSLSAGLRWADREASSIHSFGGAAYPFQSTPTSSLPGLDGISERMASGGPSYPVPQWYTPSASFLLNNIDAVRRQTAGLYFQGSGPGQTRPEVFAIRNDPVTFARKLDPGSFFSDKEVTKAAYVQAGLGGEIGSKSWSGVVGGRFIKTEQTLGGNLVSSVTTNGVEVLTFTPVTAKNDSNDFLPSASFKLNITPQLVSRLALSKTLTRPNFQDLNPGVQLSTIVTNTTQLTGTSGNASLKAVKSDNVDVALEWYFAQAGSLTGTVFYRKFDGYVQPAFENRQIGADIFRITFPANTGSGKLKGAEVGYQQFYDWLPGPLGGLGLQLNATYSSGRTEDATTGIERTITGVSKWAYNVIALYEKGPWSGRLAYNWRSSFPDAYAFATNPSGTYDIYVDNTAQADGSVAYKFNDSFTFTFEVVNLLDTKFHDYFNDKNLYPRDTRRYDRTYEVGFRARF